MAQLMSLPVELLERITHFIANDAIPENELAFEDGFDWRPLHNLSLTCKQFHNLAYPLVHTMVQTPENPLIFLKRPQLAALVKNLMVECAGELEYPSDDEWLFEEVSAQFDNLEVDPETGDPVDEDLDGDKDFTLSMAYLLPCQNVERLFLDIKDYSDYGPRVVPQALHNLTFVHLQELHVRFEGEPGYAPMNNAMAAVIRQAPNLQKCYFDSVDTTYALDTTYTQDTYGSSSVKELIFHYSMITEEFCEVIFANFPRLERFSYQPYVKDYARVSVTAGEIQRKIVRHGQKLRYLGLDFHLEPERQDPVVNFVDWPSLEEVLICKKALILEPDMSADTYVACLPQNIRKIYVGESYEGDFDVLRKLAKAAQQLPKLERVLVGELFAKDADKFAELKDAFAAANVELVVEKKD